MKRDFIGMRRIPNFSNYSATKDGKIYSHHNNRFLKTNIRNKRGRLSERIGLNDDGGRKRTMYVHRLVALAWIENPENKATVNHKDFDTLNNHVDNLEWMTMEENIAHAKENGISVKYVFSLSDIAEILELNRSGYNIGDIAKKYGCCDSVIKNIFAKENVKPITHYVRKVSEYDVLYMYRRFMKPLDIADELGCSSVTVRNIIKDNGIQSDWSKYVKNEINKMYSNGLSIDDIAKHMNLEYKYVRGKINTLREEDVFDLTTQYGIPTDRYDELIELVLGRYNRDELKKHFSVGDSALDTALKNNNLKIVRKGRLKKFKRKHDYALIYEMCKTKPQTEVAKEVGTSQCLISKIVHKYKSEHSL